MDPLLPFKLSSDFGFKEHEIGVFFFHFTAVVVLSNLLFVLIPDRFNKVIFLVFGGFVLAIGAFLTGPSRLFGLQNNANLTSTGLVIAGIGKGLLKSNVMAYTINSG